MYDVAQRYAGNLGASIQEAQTKVKTAMELFLTATSQIIEELEQKALVHTMEYATERDNRIHLFENGIPPQAPTEAPTNE